MKATLSTIVVVVLLLILGLAHLSRSKATSSNRILTLPNGEAITVVSVDVSTTVLDGQQSLLIHYEPPRIPSGSSSLVDQMKQIVTVYAPEAKQRGLSLIEITPMLNPQPRAILIPFTNIEIPIPTPKRADFDQNTTYRIRETVSGEWLPTWKDLSQPPPEHRVKW